MDSSNLVFEFLSPLSAALAAKQVDLFVPISTSVLAFMFLAGSFFSVGILLNVLETKHLRKILKKALHKKDLSLDDAKLITEEKATRASQLQAAVKRLKCDELIGPSSDEQYKKRLDALYNEIGESEPFEGLEGRLRSNFEKLSKGYEEGRKDLHEIADQVRGLQKRFPRKLTIIWSIVTGVCTIASLLFALATRGEAVSTAEDSEEIPSEESVVSEQ